jgi:DNA-binding GntR family transcriptional regulator
MTTISALRIRKLPPAEGESVTDAICDQLRSVILDGKIESGTLLRQEELAAVFGTSRIPVREAFRRLQAEGLIILQHYRGAVVAPMSPVDATDMFEIRVALECHALRLAVPNMTEDDFENGEEALATLAGERTLDGFSRSNWRYHKVLYEPCGLPKLLQQIEFNHESLRRFVICRPFGVADLKRAVREHREILEACRAQEVEKAVGALRDHIGSTRRSLLATVRTMASAQSS